MKKTLTFLVAAIMTVGAWAADTAVTSGKITIGSTDYSMTKVEGVSPDTYTVTIKLAAGNYSAHCTLNETKTTNPTTFSLKEEKDVTFWGRFPSGKTWVTLLTNANEYTMMDVKWRYYFYTAPNYDASDTGVCVTYFNAPSANYAFNVGNGSKNPSNQYFITANASGNPPFSVSKTSNTAGIKKAVLTYAEWKMDAQEATELPVKIGVAGAATLSAPAALTIPAGVKAYTLKYDGGNLVATEVKTTIPANTPVLLNAEAGTYNFSIDAETFDIKTRNYDNTNGIDQGTDKFMCDITSEDNVLVGVHQVHYVPQNSYVLQNGGSGVGFYKVNVDKYRIDPFRCYLRLPDDDPAPSRLTIVYDDQTTAISDALHVGDNRKGAVYNLAGQRVGSDYQGVVVKNGRKIFQK